MPSWVLPVIIAFIGLIGAFGAPFITCYLDDDCRNPSEPTQEILLITSSPPTAPPTPKPQSPILPPPADAYLPDHGEIKTRVFLVQEGTLTNQDIALGLENDGFGEYDEILRLLEDDFGRTTSYGYYYEAPDMCQPGADVHNAVVQVVLLKDAEGALGYLDWGLINPKTDETYPLLEVGEKGYIKWGASSSPCKMTDLGIQYQKYNTMVNLGFGFDDDQISRAEIMAMSLHLAEVIELKLDAAAQK
jgi:hypothetical protein